jgi:hypothetical protein
MTRWLPVLGYEGRYEVSDDGQVRSLLRWRGSQTRVLKPWPNRYGYWCVSLSSGGKRNGLVHTLMLSAFVGPRPPGALALHTDDNQNNNTLPNLRWGTYSENLLDMVANGNHAGANKTHCKRGHPLEGENLKRKANGARECLTCVRKRGREYMRRHRAEAAA